MDIDQQLSVTLLAEVQHDRSAVASLSRFSGEGLLLGRVRTALCETGDILGALEAIDLIEPGDVLVLGTLDATNETRHGFIGDNMALAAQRRGALAIVVDGYIRDVPSLRALGMTVVARGADITIPAGHTGRYDLARAVSIDGVEFHSGDLVAIDDEGICRIPATAADEVLDEARIAYERDQAIKQSIAAGLTLRAASAKAAESYAPSEGELPYACSLADRPTPAAALTGGH